MPYRLIVIESGTYNVYGYASLHLGHCSCCGMHDVDEIGWAGWLRLLRSEM